MMCTLAAIFCGSVAILLMFIPILIDIAIFIGIIILVRYVWRRFVEAWDNFYNNIMKK